MSEPFDPADITWTRVSPRLATARIASSSVVFGIPLVAFAVVALLTGETWPWIPVAVLALGLLWSVLLIRRQVRAIGYAERADDLLIRRGIMFRRLVVVPYGRMQYVDVSAGPLSRRFGFAAVQLHTASPITTASIDGLVPEEAARLRERLASRGEARLAGL
ncbi:MAG: PH domain-containing protein [Brevundimonas sp.]